MNFVAAILFILLSFVYSTAQPTPPPKTIYIPIAQKAPSVSVNPGVYIQQNSTMRRTSTSVFVYGEVWNNTDKPIYDQSVSAHFYDNSGNFVAAAQGNTILSMTNVKDTAPFIVSLYNAPSSVAYYKLTGTYYTQSYGHYYNLKVLNQNVRDNYGPEVFGEIQNTSGATLVFTKAAATFYDSEGNIVFIDFVYTEPNELPAEQIVTYIIGTHTIFPYSQIKVQAQGRTQEQAQLQSKGSKGARNYIK